MAYGGSIAKIRVVPGWREEQVERQLEKKNKVSCVVEEEKGNKCNKRRKATYELNNWSLLKAYEGDGNEWGEKDEVGVEKKKEEKIARRELRKEEEKVEKKEEEKSWSNEKARPVFAKCA